MKFSPFRFFILFLFFCNNIYSQSDFDEFKIMFYNVENLFDITDDPETGDEEFTPWGDRHWTQKKLSRKISNISKVILAAGGWETPDIIGLCEVENRYVVEKLIGSEQLKDVGYKIIHKESPDHRGIDVSLLYKEKNFKPIAYKYLKLIDEDGVELKTREILHVSGIVGGNDTIHLFINHWPSRYGGLLETKDLRKLAAQTLRLAIDKLFDINSDSKIIILGDFNDQPQDESIIQYLKAEPYSESGKHNGLVNLSANWLKNKTGTIKYQALWQVYDQVIVSSGLLNKQSSINCSPENATIFKPDFLLKEDKSYGGLKPFRTYNGFTYNGGFSDHLPVLLSLNLNY